MVPVSAMVQVRLKVGTWQKGSMKAVAGSGMASMSLASMLFQPRIEEPSKPRPSSKTSSPISPIGQLKCCQVPKVSTNLTSTIFAPFLRAISITLRALGPLGPFDDDVDFVLAMFQNCFHFSRKKFPIAIQQQGAQARIVAMTRGV